MTDSRVGRPLARLHQLFAVPLIVVDDLLYASTSQEIAAWAVHEKAVSAGVQASNVGGWHSLPNLPSRATPALAALFGAMVEHVRKVQQNLSKAPASSSLELNLRLQAWAMVMESGHYSRLHDHASAHWSAVYYADAGDGEHASSGRLYFVNPVGSHLTNPGLEIAPTLFELAPSTGQLVIFPGWLRHGVEPYCGSRPRVSIAANVQVGD